MKQLATFLVLLGAFSCITTTPSAEPPTEWIDPDTGRRVVRLSQELGSASLYFHQTEPAPKPETPKTSFKFTFNPGKAAPGYTQVSATTAYTKERGYGFDLGSKVEAHDRGGDDAVRGGFCTSDKPFFFSIALPEGNYNVTVKIGEIGKSGIGKSGNRGHS